MTYSELYERGRSLLSLSGVREAELDARLLLEAACHTSIVDLHTHSDRKVTEKEQEHYMAALAKRRQRIPLQLILGSQDFMGLTFSLTPGVLIPRQDTEIVVEEAMRNLHDGMRILDVGCGSGCILLSLLHYSNDCIGVGVDLSETALELSMKNAEELGIRAKRVDHWDSKMHEDAQAVFMISDLCANVEGPFDVIISNPPYIPTAEIETLDPEVKDFDPKLALDGGEDGLDLYRRLVPEAFELLRSGGHIYLEIGYNQGEAVEGLLRETGFEEVWIVKDYAGKDRVVQGEKFTV